MARESLLSVRNISKHFGDIVAVDDVSFDVPDGRFITILGPSGSGKSTILRMIAGFEKPTDGSIAIRGEDVVDVPPFERDVNMVFQHLALFPHLTVKENIAYGLKNQGVPESERNERIEEMLEMVRLSGYGDRDPTELSGGEQQRVALARAVVNQPAIVLFDEPLASLDRKLRQHMQVELQRIQAETEITFLYVTHDQEVALSVSDRLILLNDAEIEQIGTAEELYEEPNSRFVAEFIGDINVIEGTVAEAGSEVALETADGTFRFDADEVRTDGLHLQQGEPVDMCIRPHAIRFDPDNSHPNRIEGRVENRIYQGHYITYRIETDVGTLTATTEDDSLAIGDDVDLTWSPSGTYLFADEADTMAGG